MMVLPLPAVMPVPQSPTAIVPLLMTVRELARLKMPMPPGPATIEPLLVRIAEIGPCRRCPYRCR